jgi:lipopolysaccharide export system protein LptA
MIRALVCLSVIGFGARGFAAETVLPPVNPPLAAPSAPPVPTVIESDMAESISTEKESVFTFRGHVTVTATNMKMTCDELVVIALRTGDASATIGKQEKFKSLIATGNVHIEQNDREALCGRAAVYPGDDKVELTEHPIVRSTKEGWEQTGPKMVLYRGERRAVVEMTPQERPRLTLPAMKDLGYEKQKPKEKGKEGEKPSAPKPEEPAQPNSITVPGLTPQPK